MEGSGARIREVPLEAGAQGVLLTVCGDRATRRCADGRMPVDNVTRYFDVAVHQVRATSASSGSSNSQYATPAPRLLEADELTVVTGWAEGVAEALAYAPDCLEALLPDARPTASWRAALGIPEPSQQVSEAINFVAGAVRARTPPGVEPTLDALMISLREVRPGEHGLDTLARRVLRSTLEQRRMRQVIEAR